MTEKHVAACRREYYVSERGGSSFSGQDGIELTKVEREARCRARASERLADTIVASAIADGGCLAGGKHRKDRTVVIVIAAKVREIDVERLDAGSDGFRKGLERSQRIGDRRRVGQSVARLCKHLLRGTIERRKRGKRLAPRRRQLAAKL